MFEFLTKRKIHDEANILLFTIILSFLGMIIAGLLTYDEITYDPSNPSGLPGCAVGGWWDCGKVVHGPYNNIFGIPLAYLGLLGFVLIFLFSVIRLVHWGRDYTKNFFIIVLIFAFLGALLSWYLTYLELFVIHAICPYCFTSFILITIIFIVGLYGFLKGSKE
ncbi:MAG: vitamin K epoxide reductase family protein [Methanobacteriota archaeon]|nr:MAG: vitamin K epoxide reductase family protein [Euryarchaeota archaeon]